MTSPPASHASDAGPSQAATVAFAAGMAGLLDLAYAFCKGSIAHLDPAQVLQSIASGWLGSQAYAGGLPAAALGLATHFMIAGVMATVLSVAVQRWPGLNRRWALTGLAYGLGLYAVMYGLVLPLRWPDIFPRFEGWATIADVLLHMAVGLLLMAIFRNPEKRRGA